MFYNTTFEENYEYGVTRNESDKTLNNYRTRPIKISIFTDTTEEALREQYEKTSNLTLLYESRNRNVNINGVVSGHRME